MNLKGQTLKMTQLKLTCCYICLTIILYKVVSFLVQLRQSAGLLLKNNLKAQYAATAEEFRQYIKVCCCRNLLPMQLL